MPEDKLELKNRLLWSVLEKFFKDHHKVFEDCLEKLIQVSELKLYKYGDFPTFKAFFAHHFPGVPYQVVKWTIAGERKRQANKLITETTGEPIEEENKQLPKSSATSQNQNNSSPPAARKKVYDLTGREVHHTILELYQRKDEFQPFLAAISEVRCAIEKAWKEQDPLYDAVEQDALTTLNMAYHIISSARLIYVCGFCQGKCKATQQVCPHCHDRGLMTKNQWDMNVPLEIRKMVAATRKDHE